MSTFERRVFNPTYELSSPSEIAALQERRVLELVDHVQRTNSFYRETWDSAGVDAGRISSIKDFSGALPLVEKSDFLRDQTAHPPYGRRFEAAIAQGQRLDFFTTSGTSGQGTEIHAQTAKEMAGMVDSYSYGLAWSGLRQGDLVGLTIPITMFAGGRVEMQGAEGFGLSVLPLGNYDAERKLTVLSQFRPTGLLGSTSYFAHLAALHDKPSELGVSTLLTGMEAASIEYLTRLEEAWGARAFDRFGCAQMRADFMFSCERGIGTPERPGLLHNIAPNALIEVIDPATGEHVKDGEFGEIVVTSLYNTDTPLIRCRLRDGGVYRASGYCECGRPFDGVEVASISRMDDVKKVKGVNIYPQALERAVLRVREVEEYRVEISSAPDATDLAAVTVMLHRDVPSDRHETVISELAGSLRNTLGIRFRVAIGELERSEYKAKRWVDTRER